MGIGGDRRSMVLMIVILGMGREVGGVGRMWRAIAH